MALSTEQTKVLITLVDNSFTFIANERNRLCSLLDNDYYNESINKKDTLQFINDSSNKKMLACLTFNELATVLPVDEEFIDGMHSDSFNIILECIDQNIQLLQKERNSVDDIKTFVSPEVLKIIKNSFDKKVTQLEEIKNNMNSMFSYL